MILVETKNLRENRKFFVCYKKILRSLCSLRMTMCRRDPSVAPLLQDDNENADWIPAFPKGKPSARGDDTLCQFGMNCAGGILRPPSGLRMNLK